MSDNTCKFLCLFMLLLIVIILGLIYWFLWSTKKAVTQLTTNNYTNPDSIIHSSGFIDGHVHEKLDVLKDDIREKYPESNLVYDQ